MKRFIVIGILSLLAFSVSAQTHKSKNSKEDSLVNAAKKKPAAATVQPANSNTIVFVMSPEQVQLLEYVITESGASFKATNQLIQILKTQQYHPPVDSTDTQKVIPKIPSDSTAGKKN